MCIRDSSCTEGLVIGESLFTFCLFRSQPIESLSDYVTLPWLWKTQFQPSLLRSRLSGCHATLPLRQPNLGNFWNSKSTLVHGYMKTIPPEKEIILNHISRKKNVIKETAICERKVSSIRATFNLSTGISSKTWLMFMIVAKHFSLLLFSLLSCFQIESLFFC